jgi:hypothetical protein
VDALALPAEQAEDLDGLVAYGSEPVRKAGAELGDFAGSHGCLLTLRLCLPESAAYSTTGTGMPGCPHQRGEGGGLDLADRQIR